MDWEFSIFLAQTAKPSIFSYFDYSNTAGKAIVIALIVFSLLAWTIMIGKYLDLLRLRTVNRNFERKLARTDTLFDIDTNRNQLKGKGPYARLTFDALNACRFYNASSDQADSIEHIAIRMGHVENGLRRAVAEQTIQYESKMILLGSIVTGAPFMGLLGTVWGVMDAFGSMALQSTASIQNLAPGVSGALLTTVAGLLVAIPSVFGYNFLLTQNKLMVTELENFASLLADRIELELRGNL